MPARSSGWSAKHPIVVGIAANPEPDEPVRCFGREGAIVRADAGRPEAAYLLEVKRRVPRILLEARVRLLGELLTSPAAELGRTPRSRGTRDGSDRRGLAGCVVTKRPGH